VITRVEEEKVSTGFEQETNALFELVFPFHFVYQIVLVEEHQVDEFAPFEQVLGAQFVLTVQAVHVQFETAMFEHDEQYLGQTASRSKLVQDFAFIRFARYGRIEQTMQCCVARQRLAFGQVEATLQQDFDDL